MQGNWCGGAPGGNAHHPTPARPPRSGHRCLPPPWPAVTLGVLGCFSTCCPPPRSRGAPSNRTPPSEGRSQLGYRGTRHQRCQSARRDHRRGYIEAMQGCRHPKLGPQLLQTTANKLTCSWRRQALSHWRNCQGAVRENDQKEDAIHLSDTDLTPIWHLRVNDGCGTHPATRHKHVHNFVSMPNDRLKTISRVWVATVLVHRVSIKIVVDCWLMRREATGPKAISACTQAGDPKPLTSVR